MPKVLVVDDDPVMRRLITKALEPLGLELHHCSDGIHALDALRCNSNYEMLITDISMPVLDGRQLISTVCHDQSIKQLPILIMSGVVGVNEIADLLDLGATKFIPKPFNNDSFREEVISCLDLTVPSQA